MSFKEDRMVETMGDFAPRYGRGQEEHRRRHHHRQNQQQYPGAPGTSPYGTPAAAAAPAPAGQPYAGAIPTPPGNWGGGTYPPPGWQPGQPLPGYPQGWPPPGSPWPGTFSAAPGAYGAPAPAPVQYDPYGNPVVQPQQYDAYGNPVYNPGAYVPPAAPQFQGPQPTIDVTVGAAMDRGVPMATIVGCLRRRGYSQKEISGIIGACCGWS